MVGPTYGNAPAPELKRFCPVLAMSCRYGRIAGLTCLSAIEDEVVVDELPMACSDSS
jgi:hypothetical protein